MVVKMALYPKYKNMFGLPFEVRFENKKFGTELLDLTLEKNPINQCNHRTYPFKICIKICYLRKNL